MRDYSTVVLRGVLFLLQPVVAAAFAGQALAQVAPPAAAPADTGIFWWSYTHGKGWTISDALAARERESDQIAEKLNPATIGVVLFNELRTGGKPQEGGPMTVSQALTIRDFKNRRVAAEEVLMTLRGWTSRRFVQPELTGFRNTDLWNRVLSGRFVASIGVAPARDTTRFLAETAFHKRALIGYHRIYARQCRTDKSVPWITLTYDGEEWVTSDRYGNNRRRQTTLEPARLEVRLPYEYALQSIHPNDDALDVDELKKGKFASIDAPLLRDFERFINMFGCTSDVTRQFEVNLYLMALGFPSLQSLLMTTSNAGARTDVPSTSSPRQVPTPLRNAPAGGPKAEPRAVKVQEPAIDLSGLWRWEDPQFTAGETLDVQISREDSLWIGRVAVNSTTWRRNVGEVVLRLQYDGTLQAYRGVSVETNIGASRCRRWPLQLEHELALGVFDNGQTLSGEQAVMVAEVQKCVIQQAESFVDRVLRRIPSPPAR